MWECEWWSLYKTDASVKSHLRKSFPYKRLLSQVQLLPGIIDGQLFSFFQCDIEVPEHLRSYFSNFPPIFKNSVINREDIGNLMTKYEGKENIMAQLRKMLISNFVVTNGTIITPLLFFLFETWPSLWKDSPVCSIRSQKVLQHFRTVCHVVKKTKIQIPVLSLRLWNC